MTNSQLWRVPPRARLLPLVQTRLPASIIAAAQDLLGHLAAGRRIEAPAIRTAMQSAFGASDASGAWDWKTAYEAVEVAQLLFLRRYGPAIHARTADPFERLKLVDRIARLAPTQTRRSEEMQCHTSSSRRRWASPGSRGSPRTSSAANWCWSPRRARDCWRSRPNSRQRTACPE
jgi:hypothetical protein